MKISWITMFLLVLASMAPAAAQDKALTEDQLAFNHAGSLYVEKKYKESAEEFRQFMKRYPRSQLRARAHYNLGLTYYVFKDYAAGKKVFLEILDQPYNETDPNSLMEPYALYKHHSCRLLAHMSLEEKKFEEAEEYIRLFDKEYPYQHFCGNEWSAYHKYYAVMLAKVYEGTNRFTQAVEILVPHIFPDYLSSDKDVNEELIAILQNHFTKEEIRTELTRAMQSLEVKSTKKKTTATLQLYGVKVKLDSYFEEEDHKSTSALERYKKMVTESELFKKFL
ncbi:MAG: tetratricopeptide repeat protein [Bacteroidetes bacterium]|nr:tetratricopeptide repeat protein [Bacteroidota bacterium]MBI3483304.1 tetratricopeptide repeat protein [Bacteroidota bacterium]